MSASVIARLRHLPAGLAASAVVAAVGGMLAGLWRGWPGAGGAVAGVVLVAAIFVLSSVAVAWADLMSPRLVLPVGLATYLVKMIWLGLALVALADRHGPWRAPMAAAMAATVIAWLVAQAWWTWHAKVLYVDTDLGHLRGD